MSRHKSGEQKDGIAKRGSSYSYIVRVKDPETGISKQKWISGFATKEEAKAEEVETSQSTSVEW